MTRITTKAAGDLITSSDMNTLLNKIQTTNATSVDNDIAFARLFNVKNYGAVGDGVTDDAAAIQAALNAVPTGGGTVFFPGGSTYMVGTQLNVKSNTTIQLGQATLKALAALEVASDYAILELGSTTANFSRIRVIGGTIDGNRLKITGIRFRTFGAFKVSDSYVFGTTIKKCGRDANIILTGEANALYSVTAEESENVQAGTNANIFVTAVTTRRCKVIECIARNGVGGSRGIVVEDLVERILIESCFVYGNAGGGIDLLGAGVGSKLKDIEVKGCHSYDNVSVTTIPKGIFASFTDGVQIIGNHCIGNGNAGIVIDNCDEAVIVGNTSKNNSQNTTLVAGIYLSNGNRGLFVGNRCFDDQGTKTQQYGILLTAGAAACEVIGNIVSGNIADGVRIDAGTDHHVYGNKGFNPQGVAAITVTASPFTYTNSDGVPEEVHIDGGTITTVVKNAITLYSFGGTAARCAVWLEPGEALTVTYTGAPTMNKDRK